MKIAEFTITPSTKIFLDMDGVLANFTKGVIDFKQRIGDHTTDIPWNQMAGSDFFYHLEKYPTADDLVNTVLEFVDQYDICSSPLRNDCENSGKWKTRWIEENIHQQPNEIVITPKKYKWAVSSNSPNILIDDKETNIKSWNDAGGIGILYHAEHNHPSEIKKILTKYWSNINMNTP